MALWPFWVSTFELSLKKKVARNSIYVKIQACTWFETSGPRAEAACQFMIKPRKLGAGSGGAVGCPQFSKVYTAPFETVVTGSILLSPGTQAYYNLSPLLHVSYTRIRLFLWFLLTQGHFWKNQKIFFVVLLLGTANGLNEF